MNPLLALCFRPRVAFGFVALAWGQPVATAAQPAALPSKENFHLFLLIGQSNMAGRGAVEAQDQVPHPRVLTLNKAGEWVPAVDPIHFDKTIAGVGLGRTFGLEVAEATPGVTVGLIPCAVGGSHIDAWQPGASDAATKTHPWDDALRRAKLALPASTLKGILWHQGESDARRDLAPVLQPGGRPRARRGHGCQREVRAEGRQDPPPRENRFLETQS